MKRYFFLYFALLALCGCVNKHPYPYTINENINMGNKSISKWYVEPIGNDTTLTMNSEKQLDLTEKIVNYLKNKGINASLLNHSSSKIDNNCFTVKPQVIETMAEISQNEAGWNGTSEDPLSFWSHFSPGGSGMQSIEGSVPALSLFIKIYLGKQKYFENAGGIELVGKYNKFSFRTTNKKELVSDPKKFEKAMDIAFKPILTAVN